MSEDKLKKPAKKDPPHVVNPEAGAHDVPNPIQVNESEGFHSGRKVPAATPHKSLDE